MLLTAEPCLQPLKLLILIEFLCISPILCIMQYSRILSVNYNESKQANKQNQTRGCGGGGGSMLLRLLRFRRPWVASLVPSPLTKMVRKTSV